MPDKKAELAESRWRGLVHRAGAQGFTFYPRHFAMEDIKPHVAEFYTMDMAGDQDYVSQFKNWLLAVYTEEIVALMTIAQETELCYGITVDYSLLVHHEEALAELLLRYPERMLGCLDDALRSCQQFINDDEQQLQQSKLYIKLNARVRVDMTLGIKGAQTASLPRSKDVGRFLAVAGVVSRTGRVKMMEAKREMICSKCKYSWVAEATVEQDLAFPAVSYCPSPDGECKSRAFNVVEGSEVHRDFQEIKIQEQVQKLEFGSIPRSMFVLLEDDLIDSCKAGDDAIISGVVTRRWRKVTRDEKPQVDIMLRKKERGEASIMNDEIVGEMETFWAQHADRPFYARDMILKSFCSQLFGLFTVKLAAALVLIGGVERNSESGMKSRGQCHLLLVGDPGTGKSQILQYACMVSKRSVLTTGIGSTTAGLTVAAVKEKGGDWMLEAGALVLADGGVCAIDEFSSISPGDRTAIHEAMEQCCLSVAKAGIVCKLDTRTTVLAAMNGRGKYDPSLSVTMNTSIASPLLSRFDVILVLQDSENAAFDEMVSSFILKREVSAKEGAAEENFFSLEKMQQYMELVRSRFTPTLTVDAERVLTVYYTRLRTADNRNAARTTIRLLESLIRLSQAHARLMFRGQVTVDDAIVAIMLIEGSAGTSALLGVTMTVTSCFPDDPDKEFQLIKDTILRLLGAPAGQEGGGEPPANNMASPQFVIPPLTSQQMLTPWEELSPYSKRQREEEERQQRQQPQSEEMVGPNSGTPADQPSSSRSKKKKRFLE